MQLYPALTEFGFQLLGVLRVMLSTPDALPPSYTPIHQ
jgi:hypothetical protein